MDQRALKDLDITGLTADSRAVQPGFLFAALQGANLDGRDYIQDAVKRGATAVLAPPGTQLAEGVRLITDGNPRRRFARMAARFFTAQPETVAAVTGTNGKTSVAPFRRVGREVLSDPAWSGFRRRLRRGQRRQGCRGIPP